GTGTAFESVTRLDQVIEDRAHVGLGESVAELAEGTGSMPRRDGDEMRLEEPERLDPRSGGGRGGVVEMIAEGRRELPAHVLQRPRLEGDGGGAPPRRSPGGGRGSRARSSGRSRWGSRWAGQSDAGGRPRCGKRGIRRGRVRRDRGARARRAPRRARAP